VSLGSSADLSAASGGTLDYRIGADQEVRISGGQADVAPVRQLGLDRTS